MLVNFESFQIKDVLDLNFHLLDNLNKFVDETKPWELIKSNPEKVEEVLFNLAE
jgi:methionyl-tRNA synthetase